MEKEQLYKEMLTRYREQINNGGYDLNHVREQLTLFVYDEEYLKAEATKRALETLEHEYKEIN